jgi:hypothetical protein
MLFYLSLLLKIVAGFVYHAMTETSNEYSDLATSTIFHPLSKNLTPEKH